MLMNPTDVITGTSWEGADLVIMARVVGAANTPVTQATISSIQMKVFRKDTGAQMEPTEALVVADSVFDTLQTDARWDEDSTGYNFRHTVVGSAYLTEGDVEYLIQVKFTPSSGSPFAVVYEDSVSGLLGE